MEKAQDLPITKTSRIIQDRMDELGIELKDLVILIDSTYEYGRRVVKGLVVPSKSLTAVIASRLGLDEAELQQA